MNTYKLRNNKRAQRIVGNERATPNRGETQKKKNFSLCVICAVDHPHRSVKLANLQQDILKQDLYSVMTPQDLFGGKFQVTEGFEEQFKELVEQHGFNASEIYEA